MQPRGDAAIVNIFTNKANIEPEGKWNYEKDAIMINSPQKNDGL